MMEDLFFTREINFKAFKSALTVILNSLIQLRNGFENQWKIPTFTTKKKKKSFYYFFYFFAFNRPLNKAD